jgi:hypothetical protein
MSKLIGTDPNQVPSNADLGSAAFMDKSEFLLSKGSNLAAVEAVINENANDIFIYDTTKDTDGGAWRKNTKGLSWYNEPLNTATRGSRKEFPVVALIVVDSGTDKVTIYDADDPHLPMWMVADQNTNYFWESNPTKVSALNGVVVIGCNPYDAYAINFPRDRTAEYATSRITYWDEISRRNNPAATVKSFDYSRATSEALLSRNVQAIAMTVLPNAKTDSTTGIAFPTIAFATSSGVSVIKDEDTTGHIDGYNDTFYDIKFIGYHIAAARATQGVYVVHIDNVPTRSAVNENSAIQSLNGRRYQDAVDGFGVPILYADNDISTRIETSEKHLYVGQEGVTAIYENHNDYEEGLACLTTTEYNTGWQVGNTKLSTLTTNETHDFNEFALNLAENGEFDSTDLTMYTISSDEGGTNTFSVSGGQCTFTVSGAGNYASRYQEVPVVAGVTYQITTKVTASSGTNARVDCGRQSGVGGTFYPSYLNNGGELFLVGTNNDGSATNGTSPVGIITGQFVCTTSGNIRVGFRAYQNGSITVDYIRVAPIAAENTSALHPMGIHGVGHIPRQPIVTGSDIASYGPFDDNNYMTQPFTTSLDFGSTQQSFMAWIKTDASGSVFCRGSADATESMRIYIDGNNYGVYFDYGTGGQYCYLSLSTDRAEMTDGNWHHIVCHVAAGGAPKIYVDGYSRPVSISANAASTFSNANNYNVLIGRAYFSNYPFNGQIALLRVSNSVPTAEQVEKIYKDEKELFIPNAKATLYGSSDSITALSYDKGTELLHVGTSSGRSVFQGLVRTDNTTRAVNYAISAVDGMVAEE